MLSGLAGFAEVIHSQPAGLSDGQRFDTSGSAAKSQVLQHIALSDSLICLQIRCPMLGSSHRQGQPCFSWSSRCLLFLYIYTPFTMQLKTSRCSLFAPQPSNPKIFHSHPHPASAHLAAEVGSPLAEPPLAVLFNSAASRG